MRRVLVVSVVALATVLVPITAHAAVPDREPFPASDFSLPAGAVCSFGIDAHFVVSREYITTFFDKAGNVTRQQVEGALVETLTNTDSGASVTLNISGPTRLVVDANGIFHFTALGRGTYFNLDPAFATLFIGRALLDATLDPTTGIFYFNVVSAHGIQADLCQLLS